jgi:cytochrome c553
VIFTTRTAIVASIAWVATVAGLASATTPQFDDLRNQAPVRGDAAAGAAKAAACAACHGAKGIAAAPTFPNLAGQSETYLYVQLRAFKGGARVNAVMQPLAKTLADQDMRNLAAHFASLPGKAAPRTHGNLRGAPSCFMMATPLEACRPARAAMAPTARGRVPIPPAPRHNRRGQRFRCWPARMPSTC